MGRADEAPQHAGDDEEADDIARPDMHLEQVVFGEVGDGEAHHQGPVEHAHERVPDIDLGGHAALIAIEHGIAFSRSVSSEP